MTETSKICLLFRRAEEEAIAAIRCDCTVASAAHFELSLHYGALARAALLGTMRKRRCGTRANTKTKI